MFDHAYQFNSDLSKWDVGKVSTMVCSKYSSFPCSLVSTFCHMFSNPNTCLLSSSVFERTYSFNSDVSKWNVAKVSAMHHSKYSSSSHCLVFVHGTFFLTLTRAFSLHSVFERAHNFNSDVSKWNVAKVGNMRWSTYCLVVDFLRLFC